MRYEFKYFYVHCREISMFATFNKFLTLIILREHELDREFNVGKIQRMLPALKTVRK